MPISEIENLLNDAMSLDELYVSGEGSHYKVIAVSEVFDGLSRVKQQQLIYAPLKPLIADGSVHAVTIKAYTPAQWQREKKFQMPL